MKAMVSGLILAGLLIGGTAFAAEPPCQTTCACQTGHVNKTEKDGAVYKPLFPELEFKAPLGG